MSSETQTTMGNTHAKRKTTLSKTRMKNRTTTTLTTTCQEMQLATAMFPFSPLPDLTDFYTI